MKTALLMAHLNVVISIDEFQRKFGSLMQTASPTPAGVAIVVKT